MYTEKEGPESWARIPRPNLQELQKVHQELGLWMSHTRYQLHEVDRIPLYRLQNTSITMATGLGMGSYFALKRLRPGITFPLDVLAPFVTFCFTHRLAQAAQMPSLWDTFLGLPSPLGDTARSVLAAVRSNKRLPSDDFGRLRPREEPAKGPPAEGVEAASQQKEEVSMPGFMGGAPAMPGSSAPTKEEPEDAWGSMSWAGQDSGSDAPKRTSWEEIRARAAQKDGRSS